MQMPRNIGNTLSLFMGWRFAWCCRCGWWSADGGQGESMSGIPPSQEHRSVCVMSSPDHKNRQTHNNRTRNNHQPIHVQLRLLRPGSSPSSTADFLHCDLKRSHSQPSSHFHHHPSSVITVKISISINQNLLSSSAVTALHESRPLAWSSVESRLCSSTPWPASKSSPPRILKIC